MPDYKVRTEDATGKGDLITIVNAATKAAAEAAALSDPDAVATGAVDVEKLATTEAAKRGQATEVTAAAIASSADGIENATQIIQTMLASAVSVNNNTTVALAGAGVYQGAADDCLDVPYAVVSLAADQAGTLTVQWSTDAVNWDIQDQFAVTAGTAWGNTLLRRARYLRIRYVNGAAPQGYLRLKVILAKRADAMSSAQLPVRNDPTGFTTQPVSIAVAPTVNQEGELFSSAARAASAYDSADIANNFKSNLIVFINATAITATPDVVFKIQGKCPVSGQYYTILASTSVVAISTRVLRVGPGLATTANLSENHPLPKTWRLRAEHADGDSITYSASYSMS